MAGLNGYAQLRRGLLEHLPEMNGSDLKCYIALVLMANPRNGSVRITTRDLGETLGTGANRVSESMHRLEGSGYLEVERARNQHSITSIRITKWKRGGNTAVDDAVNTAVDESGQQSDSKRTASGQHDGSDQRKPEYKSHESHESHENKPNPRFAGVHSLASKRLNVISFNQRDRQLMRMWADMQYPDDVINAALDKAIEKADSDRTRIVYAHGCLRNGIEADKPQPPRPKERVMAPNGEMVWVSEVDGAVVVES